MLMHGDLNKILEQAKESVLKVKVSDGSIMLGYTQGVENMIKMIKLFIEKDLLIKEKEMLKYYKENK